MVKIGSLFIAFMLFASISFAWVVQPPSTFSSYSVVGVNFTYSTSAQSAVITTSTKEMFGWHSSAILAHTAANFTVKAATVTNLPLPIGGNFTGSYTHETGGTETNIACNKTGAGFAGGLNNLDAGTFALSMNTTDNLTYTISFKPTVHALQTVTCNNTDGITITSGGFTPDNVVLPFYNASFKQEMITPTTALNASDYIGTNGNSLVRSDFITSKTSTAVPSNYCRFLLYFNNPYYGNIQLIPRITYHPGVDAFANFINTTDNSAYIPNETLTYIFDRITSTWYIVPATTCTSYTSTGSTTTLQYNPTATGTAPGGTVPIDVYDISGSCSYATATRLISCTGTDTSSTVTSLTLSAYLSGNTTDLCGSTVGGASGTLTCTLPAQNGSYNVIFYGTDANLFLHSFASKTIVIGSAATGYGRDTYIAVLLLASVAALLLSSNIAVSMVLMCFGLFTALAVGALPISDAPVVVFFAVIALVLAYRLKV